MDDYLIRDEDGMVSEIQLKSGELCDRRVCPHCHNPLPYDYGKYTTRFITVIGGFTSGKTVFLSQLIDRMSTYAAKNGLDAHVRAEGTLAFQRNYRVRMNKQLPRSTQPEHFQQPLVYELVRRVDNSQVLNTVVLYDVSGEVFQGSPERVRSFAPFVRHADGVIVLLDPMQIMVFSEQADEKSTSKNTGQPKQELLKAEEMLNSIYRVVSREIDAGRQSLSKSGTRPLCTTPFAICLSKSDLPCVQTVLDPDLYQRMESEMTGIMGKDGFYRAVFDAHSYNPILDGLDAFFKKNEDTLALCNTLHNNYLTYAFFAFTALGCPAEEREPNVFFPVGPRLAPKRIEEPLLWLFHEMKYTGVNEGIHYPGRIPCPRCGWYLTGRIRPEPKPKGIWKRIAAWFHRLFHPVKGNMKCSNCGNVWFYRG